MITEPDVCSEGLSSLKFSFGLTPYFKKEESNNTDKGDIAQMAERLDKTVSLEHQLQSNDASESPCSTMETAGEKQSLSLKRWEKREAPNVECSPPTTCGDRAMRSDGPPSFSAEPSQTYEKDLSTNDEAMTPINLMQNHDEFINAVKSQLTKLEEEHDNIKGMKGKNQPPEWSDYKSMPFSQCIINETLRVANIISLGSNRGRLNRTRNRTISGAGMDEGNPRCRCSGSPEVERVGSPRGG
ncbi:hypothetical protein GUJ93_ZPchr0011g28799 [Zizania palustris]|uniref:Uncharacterized protein n=1 Tax=Zizania palustris TaxID=103762 RepID=A0A8J6BSB6_ZIZPA|nr:hypothetical protein GUJ93_ZPchr0011g28799 [Zizania palustris]